MRVILASASPRRRELLRAAGIAFDADPMDVDERRLEGEPPARYVERLGRSKALACAARHPGRVVIGADTAVVLGDNVLGKPETAADAFRMLRLLRGRSHEVLTGVAATRDSHVLSRVERTVVYFTAMSDAEIASYVATGEPMDKAGAYGIQGRAGRYISRIEGSYSNVVGLPLTTLVEILREFGSELTAAEIDSVDSTTIQPYPEE